MVRTDGALEIFGVIERRERYLWTTGEDCAFCSPCTARCSWG